MRLPSCQDLSRRVPRWARLPLGLALIAGGALGFLPVLGFWMVPLGVVVMAPDSPFVAQRWERFRGWVHGRLDRRAEARARKPAAQAG